jgi:hypothetical protein
VPVKHVDLGAKLEAKIRERKRENERTRRRRKKGRKKTNLSQTVPGRVGTTIDTPILAGFIVFVHFLPGVGFLLRFGRGRGGRGGGGRGGRRRATREKKRRMYSESRLRISQ